MKLQFLKQSALFTLKSNINGNLLNYGSPTNDWIFTYFGEESPFADFKQEVPEFQLLTDPDKPESTDIENIKIIYLALKDVLSESQATDERFWSGLEHGVFWDYTRNRWRLSGDGLTADNIMNHFFFKQNPKRALSVNALSRLWWIGNLTYDKSNTSDPFYLLKCIEVDLSHRVLILLSRNYTNNPTIARAFLKAVIELECDGRISGREYNALSSFVNEMGGTYILDYLTEGEIKDKIINYHKDTFRSLRSISV